MLIENRLIYREKPRVAPEKKEVNQPVSEKKENAEELKAKYVRAKKAYEKKIKELREKGEKRNMKESGSGDLEIAHANEMYRYLSQHFLLPNKYMKMPAEMSDNEFNHDFKEKIGMDPATEYDYERSELELILTAYYEDFEEEINKKNAIRIRNADSEKINSFLKQWVSFEKNLNKKIAEREKQKEINEADNALKIAIQNEK
ncbi:hypothetical protein GF340_03775 [Candidatus Peregrinibacteria bacterium]|nr:hypothetical protein [Candidatus Peregrinibacteria bacterium]